MNVPYVDVIECGGLRRRVPVGGSANGMPLKVSMMPLVEPTTVPFFMLAEGARRALCCMAGAAQAVAIKLKRKYVYIV